MLARAQPQKSVEAWQFAWMHNDATVRDYSLAIETSDPKTHPILARTLLEIDPRSAFAMATRRVTSGGGRRRPALLARLRASSAGRDSFARRVG